MPSSRAGVLSVCGPRIAMAMTTTTTTTHPLMPRGNVSRITSRTRVATRRSSRKAAVPYYRRTRASRCRTVRCSIAPTRPRCERGCEPCARRARFPKGYAEMCSWPWTRKLVKPVSISPSNPRGTIQLRVVDPDHDPSAQPVRTEGPYAGFDGEIAVPLPKVFDWLYYTFFAGSKSWQLRYW